MVTYPVLHPLLRMRCKINKKNLNNEGSGAENFAVRCSIGCFLKRKDRKDAKSPSHVILSMAINLCVFAVFAFHFYDRIIMTSSFNCCTSY